MFNLFRYSESNILKVLERLDKKSQIRFNEYELIQKEFRMLDSIDDSKLFPDEIHKLKVLTSNGINNIIKKYKK
jgi:hypothetical protein